MAGMLCAVVAQVLVAKFAFQGGRKALYFMVFGLKTHKICVPTALGLGEGSDKMATTSRPGLPFTSSDCSRLLLELERGLLFKIQLSREGDGLENGHSIALQ